MTNIKLFMPEALKSRFNSFKESLYLLKQNSLTFTAALIIIFIILIAVFAPYIAPYPEHVSSNNPHAQLLPPSAKYICGTDELGRDIFSRIIFGTRISLIASVTAVGIALLIGVPLGLIAGYYGGFLDELIMRITDMFLSFPPLLLAMAIAAFLGPNLRNAILAIIVSWWPWFTRLIRGQTVSIKEKEFVRAAKSIGTSSFVIMFKHILPNAIAPVIVQASMDLGGIILTLASLSFLGLGAQPPIPEWGLMVNTSLTYFMNAWWYGIFPGLAIFITVLAFNLMGDGLREILDPKTRGQ